MAIPAGVIALLVPVIKRFINTKKVKSKTNISTGVGGSMVAASAMLISLGDPTSQGLGYLLGLIGIGVTFYKDKND